MLTVVTGASGHVGANLVRALLEEGRTVRVLVHEHSEALAGLPVEVVRGDVRDPASLRRAFAGADTVFHLAAIISLETGAWPALESVNVAGVRNMVAACLDCKVKRLVHFSSIHALAQEPLTVPVTEAHPYVGARHPPYDRSKAAGEREVRQGMAQGLNAVIIAPTGIIGPLDYHPSHAGQMLLSLAERRMPALVTGGFDWVDVRDVVAGALRAERLAPAGTKYLLGGHWASLREIAGLVAACTGTPAPQVALPAWVAGLGAPVVVAYSHLRHERPIFTAASIRAVQSNRNISHEKASRELGYAPRPFAATIRDTLAWFQETGRLPQRCQP